MYATFMRSLITLSVCMLAGYVGRKARVLTDDVNAAMTSLLVRITLPCSVFLALMRPFSKTLLLESFATIIISALLIVAGLGFGAVLAKLMKADANQRRVWQFALMFANTGYMGFPVSQAVFGEESLIYTSMVNMAFNILVFTIGVKLFTPHNDNASKKRDYAFLLNPALVATYLGLIFFVSGLRLPTAVEDSVSLLSAATTPLSMLLVGSILAKIKLRALFGDISILPVIVFRLLIIPLATFVVVRPFVNNPMMLGVIVLLSAMPVASLAVILAEQYNGDTELSSKLVALSTACCALTIPIVSLVLGIF